MKFPCNCDTGGRSGGQVHDPDCAGIPSMYGAWMSEYTCREWMKEQQTVIDSLSQACTFVKVYLTRLESGTAEDDPLLGIRRKVHGPLHAVLDAALAKARGES